MRIERLREEFQLLSEEKFEESRKNILKQYREKKQEVQRGICKVFSEIFQRGIAMQEKEYKDQVRCICIFCLRSSWLTGSCHYHISLYNPIFYLDRQEVSGNYTPIFIQPFFKKDMEELISKIQKQYMRLKNYEKERMMLWHMEQYHKIMKEIFEDTIGKLKELPAYRALGKTEDHLFLFGEYMSVMDCLGGNL